MDVAEKRESVLYINKSKAKEKPCLLRVARSLSRFRETERERR